MANKNGNILSNAKEAVKNKMSRPAMRTLIIGGLALLVLVIILLVVKFWTFSNYKVEVTDNKENTLAYRYYTMDGKILKYASDTASFVDSKNESLWTITYEMNDPRVDSCGSNIVIYDKKGTTVYLCDEDGKKSTFNSQLPIIKAEIAKQGTVALLQDDGQTAQVDYYDSNGSVISTIKTTLVADGYPMDIALSENGMDLVVSYINYVQGTIVSDVDFYNFGSQGQMATDNIVGSFRYEDTIIPQVEFMGSKNCVAFGTGEVVVYDCGKTPRERSVITLEDEIKSTAVGENYFATVMIGNDNTGYEITVYNSTGSVKSVINTDFAYTSIEIDGDLVIAYNRNAMCIYAADGICKFNGQFDFFVRQIRFIDANRYLLAATDSFNIIRLY